MDGRVVWLTPFMRQVLSVKIHSQRNDGRRPRSLFNGCTSTICQTEQAYWFHSLARRSRALCSRESCPRRRSSFCGLRIRCNTSVHTPDAVICASPGHLGQKPMAWVQGPSIKDQIGTPRRTPSASPRDTRTRHMFKVRRRAGPGENVFYCVVCRFIDNT